MKIALTCKRNKNTGTIEDYSLETLFRTRYLLVYNSETNKITIYELEGFENVKQGDKGPALAKYIRSRIGKIDVLGTPRRTLEVSETEENPPWEKNVVAGDVNNGAKGVIETLIKKYGKEVKK
ncbi:MAG: hypothetical protein KAT94_03730 [Candidatus Aenigmarchaeota archaeon]|nr:hypothetical protein [Candidatus Aenigmarchaeota archaeon]MCK4531953.1 hypothetical protein [Candidatus Aenigmarchaeota archaeon]